MQKSVSSPAPSAAPLLQWLVVLAILATIAVNALANILPIAGRQTGEISDSFPSFFTPAGYVFAIWGVIYLALLAYAVYQALPAQRDNPRLVATRGLFVLSCGFNVAWLLCWHYLLIVPSMAMMIGLLITLVLLYVRLGVGQFAASAAESWLARVPFSIYLGWITVATVANAVTTLIELDWNGWGISGQVWALLLVLVAAGIGVVFARGRRDVPFNLVLLWAFGGIWVAHASEPVVVYGVVAGLLMVLAGLGVAFSRRS
ncbi:TspO/MBR family protein [Meiothermus sp. CFH 77666]|uniref:TspO/MBR family protein n=1 Tax=Meiothermus sp. CFH 77666 TaxID=2817942 RepID=UPI001AA0726E|nr:TspO/MBR family protein [Meiothermus sp. CFH 77666]MBO1438310.1 tryptophan-rich sensory protein [Meiothermus sp. CFH 77666]